MDYDINGDQMNERDTQSRAEFGSEAGLPHMDAMPMRSVPEDASDAAPELGAFPFAKRAPTRQAPPSKWERELFDWMQTIVSSLILVSLTFAFAARVIGVFGDSMQNTLFSSQKVLISNLFYTPKPGDIVVFTKKDVHLFLPFRGEEDEPLIKRVIATEGQTVDIDFEAGEIRVGGVLLNEPYIRELTMTPGNLTFPHTVPKGMVFVMGDNRNKSMDSRVIGPVDTRYILGRVLMRVWPLADFGPIDSGEAIS